MIKKIENKNKIKNRFKKTMGFVLAVCLILFGLFSVNYSRAATVSDLQKKQSDLSKQITDGQQKVKETKKDIQQISGDIGSIESDISETEQKISETETNVSNTENQIKNKEEEIVKEEQELAQEQEDQRETVRTMYEMQKHNNPLKMLFSNFTLSQSVTHNTYLDALENRIEATIDEINKIKTDLVTQKQELEADKKALEGLQEQQKAYKRGLDDQKSVKEKILSNKQVQQGSLEDQIEESKKLRQQVESEISSIMAAQKATNNGRTVIARDRGVSDVGFMWPMDYKYISTHYGGSTPFQDFHSGVDLVNIAGTPIYATAKGTVTSVASMMYDGHYYGYGNYVVIGHNARYSSLYAHLQSFAISTGDEVERGQIIGYEGSTGWSTGPHLHFEIWEYGQRKNPISYLP